MVAIFTGSGSGFERGSASVLGSQGRLGNAELGRGGEGVSVNAATGNLLINQRDEFLVGRGPDSAILRTYNSLGDLSDENADNWRQGTDRRVYGLTGTLNAAGSTVRRVSADGSDILYTWDSAKAAYVTSDGSGAHDQLTSSAGVWTWTDGGSQLKETYAAYGAIWRISQQTDTDGNALSFTYSGANLTQVSTADGGTITYEWSGNRVTRIVTASQGASLARTYYSYDTQGRLNGVTLDLSPNDFTVGTGATYTTTYTYHGTSLRVASIAQSDGSRVDIAYDASNRVTTLTETVASGVTRTTTLAYGAGYTNVTDPTGQVTRLDYSAAQQLTKITLPPGQTGSAAQVLQFGYNVQGDLITATDPAGNVTTYTHDSSGNVVTETDRLGNVISRTYGSKNQLLTETRTGSNTTAAAAAHTTRFVHDGENHLRFVVTAEGTVTEYRYDRYGLEIAKLEYPESVYSVAGLASSASIAESAMAAWVSALPDRSSVKRTNTYYDLRGNVSSVVTSSSATRYGEGADSAQIVAPGANTTVTAEADGSHRITKTSGTEGVWDGDAHSLVKAEGDFVLRLRPVQNNKATIAGLATAPAANASYTNPEYGLYFVENGSVYYMESGSYVYLNVNYVPGDTFWITRSGGTINYYKGASLGVAQAAGALRTHTAATQPLYFDSSFLNLGAAIDVTFNPFDINTGIGAQVFPQSDGSYRIVKNAGAAGWDQDARSTIKADGDFVLRLKPGQNNKHMVGGVALSPGASTSYTNPDYGFYFVADGSVHYMEAGSYVSLGVTHSAGDNFWLVRSGTTISYYKGSTLESAIAAGALRTRTGSTGSLYFDSSFHDVGASMEADFRPATAIANGVNTAVTTTADGLYRITKTGGSAAYWDADARSSTKTDGDFVLRLRLGQSDKNVIGGVATNPSASAYYTNPDYGLFFVPGGAVHYMEAGNYQPIAGVTYVAGDNFWVTRVGSTISYYKGATLEAAIAAGAIRTRTGVSGTFHFDSSFHETGAVMDVSFTPVEDNGGSAVLNRTSFVYDQGGQLLSRRRDGENAETFIYDGLGRMTAKTDVNGGTTTIVFNDAATTTTITLASGYVTTSTYNKVGNLISQSDGGSYVAAGTSNMKYDKLGKLRVWTDATGFSNYYIYDKAGRKVADANHYGDLVEYRYDSSDRLVTIARFTNRLTAAQLATLANPDAVVEMSTLRPAAHSYDVWTFTVYDKEGRKVAAIGGDGGVTAYAYDGSGRLVATTSYFNKLSAAQVDAFKASPPATAVLPAADARDSVARTFYDANGLLIGELDGEGYLSQAVYDKAGQKVANVDYANVTTSTLRATGTFAALLASVGSSTADRYSRYVYDNQGQLRFAVNAVNQVIETSYDAAGRVTSNIRYAAAMAATSDYTYDNVKALVASLAGNAANRTTRIVYDSAGREAFAIAADGSVVAKAFDNRGQVTKQVQFAALYTAAGLPSLAAMNSWQSANIGNAANRVSRLWYTARGEARYLVDAEGYISRTDYDAEGRAVGEYKWDNRVIVSDSTTIAQADAASAGAGGYTGTTRSYRADGKVYIEYDGLGTPTLFDYYANGLLAARYEAYNTADQAVTYFVYDAAGQLIAEYGAHGTADQTVTQYGYDGLGNRTSVIDARGKTTSFTYDRIGQVKSITNPVGQATTYDYNGFGEAWKTTDARGNASYVWYDRLGRRISEQDAESYLTETAYTAFGEVASVTRRFNKVTATPAVGSPPTVVANATEDATASFVYDKLGRQTKMTDALAKAESYAYNAFGNRTSMTNRLGAVTTYTYDRRGAMLTETLPASTHDSAGTLTSSNIVNRFEYDSRGNRTKMVEADNLSYRRTTIYTYNRANQMIQRTGDSVSVIADDLVTASSVTPTETIKYDLRGNIIETVDAGGGRVLRYYDDHDRQTVEINSVGTYSAWYYDANGHVAAHRVYATAVALPASGSTAPAAPGGAYRETTYGYDNASRMTSSSVANVVTGVWNGASYIVTTGSVSDTLTLDGAGNIITATDPNGAQVFYWYDKLGRQTAMVDAQGYLTTRSFDPDGNVTSERAWATRFTGVSNPLAAAPTVVASADDRITDYTYDKNGRKLSEKRYNVTAYTVDANGALVAAATAATVSYLYNALGQVTRRTEATGEFTQFVYDTSGRLTSESRAAFTDFNGQAVTPTIDYYYNGLGTAARMRQRGATGTTERVVTYAYGAGGRLASSTDAAGFTRSFAYDAAGRVKKESFTRVKADGSSVNEAIATRYDLSGRSVYRGIAYQSGSAFTTIDYSRTEYNSFGEIGRQGSNGLWQVENKYDNAGRLLATNSGDGVWKYFGYDRAGNQTLAVNSAGYDLPSTLTLAGAVALIGQADVNGTYTVYDNRGLGTQVVEEGRQLSATVSQTLITGRTFNAFGEIASETNALGATLNYTYNTLGRRIRIENPYVTITLENGTTQSMRPTENYYHDLSGRLLGARDANNNLSTRSLLAGTGYGDSGAALVAIEFSPDGGRKTSRFDIHGDARVLIDEIGRTTSQTFDGLGRVVQINRPSGLVESYAYDGLGQRIQNWNSVHQTPVYGPPQQVWVEEGYYDPYYGWVDTSHWETQTPIIGYAPEKELTDYDSLGRVTRQVAFGGDTTSTAYSWNGSMATTGLGTFGGWTQTTTFANSRTLTVSQDFYGRETSKTDLGGHVFADTYDKGGRLVARGDQNYVFLNTGQIGETFTMTGSVASLNWARKSAKYGYDAIGNRTSEYTLDEGRQYSEYWDPYYGYQVNDYSWSNVYQNATATYDALGRLTSFNEAGGTNVPAASIAYAYDANGNVRRSTANYRTLDHNGAASGYVSTQDQWYRYDALNRVVTAKGILSGGQIVRGTGGVDYLYDQAGQRIRTTRTTTAWASIYDPYGWDPYYGGNQYISVPYDADTREDYTFDAAGNLSTVRSAQSGYTDNGDGTLTVTPPAATGDLKASYTFDLLGRMTRQIDWLYNGTNAGYDRSVVYNTKGQVTSETVVTKRGSETHTNYISNNYGSGTGYALGSIVSSSSSNYKNGAYQNVTNTSTSYAWWDGAVQSSVTTTQGTTATSNYYYDAGGRLTSIYIGGARARSITFTNDMNGQAIRRDESDNVWNQGDPHEVWYRFNGKQLGYTGNNGTYDTDYQSSIYKRTQIQGTGAFQGGSTYAAQHADFDLSLDPINSYNQGGAGSSYTVRMGDTLAGIAAQLWGDSSLWYRLADANGMSAANALVEGQRLIVPSGVMKSQHNASTFKPYNPAEIIGDTSATTPQPKQQAKKGKCGAFGQILLMVIAVAISVALPIVAPATFGGIIGGIGAAVVGNVVSQGVGLATGIQDKFNWKGLAMSAIGAGVGGGLGQVLGKSAVFGSKLLTDIVRGAASSAITQGIGVATGLQSKFDWAGVAAAGMAAGVGGAVSRALTGPAGSEANTWNRPGGFGHDALVNLASTVASAATRSAVEGSSFKDNLLAALPGAIGSTIGNAVGVRVGMAIEQMRFDRALADLRRISAMEDGQAPDGSASACFVAGTLVHTPSGTKPIEEVRAGDIVFARQEEGKDPTLRQRKVIETYRYADRTVLSVDVAALDGRNMSLNATPEHPFWVEDKGWTAAQDLAEGDVVSLVDGSTAVVTNIVGDDGLHSVFNFAVEQDHTYFVGALGVWVHNEYQTRWEDAARRAYEFGRTHPARLARSKALLDRWAAETNAAEYQAIERLVAARYRDDGLLGAHAVSRQFLAAEQAAQNHFGNILANPIMPDVTGLDAGRQYAVYASFVIASGDATAIADLRAGNRVIVGLRQETSTTVNRGQGAYDDRIIVLWREGNNNTPRVERFNANTEPSAQYDWRAGGRGGDRRAASAGYENVIDRKIDGQDANGDGRQDLGRLNSGVYRYTKSTASNGRQVNGDGIKHILRPDTNNPVQRDSNGDGFFNGNDPGRNNLDDDRTMYFHPGGISNTFSAGCQTLQSGDWQRFWTSLGTQDHFSYVLRNTRR
ncbi:MAG TPA: polymorphic toxin-type HINT domain-containing protein [Allosphingosinicella sp.]|jgi:YD repeat-containing protein